jgi:hypothetical protein
VRVATNAGADEDRGMEVVGHPDRHSVEAGGAIAFMISSR